MALFDDIVERVSEYLRHRALWAAQDFRSEASMIQEVQRIQEQEGEAMTMTGNYKRMVSRGLSPAGSQVLV